MSNLKEIYKETLTQVLALEAGKKDLARQMLQQRDPTERRLTVIEFIRQDQQKHKLLGQMVAEGTNRQEAEILSSISNLYGVEKPDDLWNKVESQQRLNQRMLELLEREITSPGAGDFLERRLLMEIEKQALRQAQDYMNPVQNG